MKIRAIRIDGYGLFGEMEFDALADLVVFFGPNESGKTTLRRFIGDLLFGFQPANREDHPYTPWGSEKLGGEIDFERNDGGGLTVSRRMRATIQGEARRNGETEKIANRAVLEAGAVQRKVFESVYALAREDLEFPDATWDDVKDRLIGGAGLEALRPAREVIAELEAEANRLWREDQKGKPRSKEIRARLKDLGDEVRKARERDREIREAKELLAERLAERDGLDRARIEGRARIRRLRRLADDRGVVEAIERNEEIAGDPGLLDGLPDDPAAFLADRERWIATWGEELRAMEEEKERAEADAARFTDGFRRALESERAIREAIERGRDLLHDAEALRRNEADVAAAAEKVRGRARTILSEPEAAFTIRPLSIAEIQGRVDRYQDLRRKREDHHTTLEAIREPGPDPSAVHGFLVAVAGLAAILLFPVLGEPLRWIVASLGISTLVMGVYLFLRARRAAGDAKRARDLLVRREGLLAEARREEERARDDVRTALVDIPVIGALLEEPTEILARGLRDLDGALEEWRTAGARLAEKNSKVGEGERALLDTARVQGIEPASVGEALRALEVLVEEAGRADEAKKRADGRLADLAAKRPQWEERLGEARREVEEVRARLAALDPKAADEAVHLLKARRWAAKNAEEGRARLEREGKNFEELREKIREALAAEGTGDVSEEEILRLEAEVEEGEKALNVVHRDIGEIRARVERMTDEKSASEIEGEREALRAELAEAEVERDRLLLLAGVVREGDRRYRAEHEPDIIQRTRGHFAEITGGRYGDLAASDGGLVVLPPGGENPVPAGEPLSRGTLDQLYLSLRLALVDHLESGGEKLPLFLDEVFAHWDEERTERGLEILSRIAKARQVFLFTCHEPLRRRLVDRGAGLVTLKGPAAAGGGA